jgi:hypothetical protein
MNQAFYKKKFMTSPEILYMKNVVNELNFLLVTHTTCFDTRFDRYEFLNLGFSVGQILDRLVYRCLVRFLVHKIGQTCWGLHTRSEDHLLSFPTPTQTHISHTHSHGYGHFSTATCGVSGLLKNLSSNGLKLLAHLRTAVRI